MKNLTLQHIRYLTAVSEHGHFGRAASDCAISQPALSVQMKNLEAMVGAPLLERGTRKVRLTQLGEDFVARGRNILSAVEELGDIARSAQNDFYGDLKFGIIPTIAPYLLPSIVTAIQKHLPIANLKPREAITSSLVEDLLEHRLDIALVALPVSDPGLEEVAVFEEEFVLVRPVAERNKPVPPPEKLTTLRLLLLEEGHCFRDQALSFCTLDGTQPRDLMEGSSLSTLVQMVGAGLGLTLIPEMALPLEGRVRNTCIQRFSGAQPKRTVGLIWRKTNPMSEQFRFFKDVIARANQRTLSEISSQITPS
ncbi:MAG: hydrogen peroxide-inducible genes activator [Pseudomonadota bacterium]